VPVTAFSWEGIRAPSDHSIHLLEHIMRKFIGYTLCILVILFLLEWFRIVDIPYFDIPDYTGSKKDLIEKSQETLKD
jgi:hypothetical protein